MNRMNRKIILEHVQVAKTALSRMHQFYRGAGLHDEGSTRLSNLNIAISEVESYFFNQPDDPPEEHPLIWALRTALENNPEVSDLDIARLVRGALPEGWVPKIYEVTLEGFDGSQDTTDEFIKWVAAPNREAVEKYCQLTGFGIPVRAIEETKLRYSMNEDAVNLKLKRDGSVL